MEKFIHFPNTIDKYKVSFLPSIVEDALEIFYYLESNLLFESSYSRLNAVLQYNPLLFKVVSCGTLLPKYLHSKMSNVVNTILFDEYLNFGFITIRMEKLFPNRYVQDLDKRRTRFNELIPSSDLEPSDLKYTHPSLLWHFDSKINSSVSY